MIALCLGTLRFPASQFWMLSLPELSALLAHDREAGALVFERRALGQLMDRFPDTPAT